MASVQVQAKVQLSDKERLVIGEAVKEAQDFVAKNKDANSMQLATVAGAMKNYEGRPVMLNKSQEWFGHFVVKPPETMGGHGSGSFVHTATSVPGGLGTPGPVVLGSKAAVVYCTYDKALPQLGYLLAWYKSENSNEYKVYVEAGELSKLMKQDWNEIEQKLDASHSTSRCVDKETGATAVAEITIQGGNMAWLGACFNQLFFDGNSSQA
ncbi:Jasmonate-induced protein-like protein [Bienertia sinuspersici]